GGAVVIPLSAPIGSNGGRQTREMLRILIEQPTVPAVIDAGIGAPSLAAEAIQMGADAVLVNPALGLSRDPVAMATAFRLGVEAGVLARDAQLAPRGTRAEPSSPLTSFLGEDSRIV